MDASLRKRLVTSLLLAPLCIWVVIAGGVYYDIGVMLCGFVMYSELYGMLRCLSVDESGGSWSAGVSSEECDVDYLGNVHMHPPPTRAKVLTGVWQALIAIWAISLIIIRSSDSGIMLTSWLLFSVWSADIGAYFAGRAIGGWRICKSISPNKTYSGLLGGCICSIICGVFFSFYWSCSIRCIIKWQLLISLVALAGDLFESSLKRTCSVKDSGGILPGHGGILDRVDGLLFTAPIVAIVSLFV